jgi:hypothetical protein
MAGRRPLIARAISSGDCQPPRFVDELSAEEQIIKARCDVSQKRLR